MRNLICDRHAKYSRGQGNTQWSACGDPRAALYRQLAEALERQQQSDRALLEAASPHARAGCRLTLHQRARCSRSRSYRAVYTVYGWTPVQP